MYIFTRFAVICQFILKGSFAWIWKENFCTSKRPVFSQSEPVLSLQSQEKARKKPGKARKLSLSQALPNFPSIFPVFPKRPGQNFQRPAPSHFPSFEETGTKFSQSGHPASMFFGDRKQNCFSSCGAQPRKKICRYSRNLIRATKRSLKLCLQRMTFRTTLKS